jgi:ABC-type uncharacterized transport system ATPase subunit
MPPRKKQKASSSNNAAAGSAVVPAARPRGNSVKLRSVQIKGFRSFSGQTTVQLADSAGLTAVVGPNGAGKHAHRDLTLQSKMRASRLGSEHHGINLKTDVSVIR